MVAESQAGPELWSSISYSFLISDRRRSHSAIACNLTYRNKCQVLLEGEVVFVTMTASGGEGEAEFVSYKSG